MASLPFRKETPTHIKNTNVVFSRGGWDTRAPIYIYIYIYCVSVSFVWVYGDQRHHQHTDCKRHLASPDWSPTTLAIMLKALLNSIGLVTVSTMQMNKWVGAANF